MALDGRQLDLGAASGLPHPGARAEALDQLAVAAQLQRQTEVGEGPFGLELDTLEGQFRVGEALAQQLGLQHRLAEQVRQCQVQAQGLQMADSGA